MHEPELKRRKNLGWECGSEQVDDHPRFLAAPEKGKRLVEVAPEYRVGVDDNESRHHGDGNCRGSPQHASGMLSRPPSRHCEWRDEEQQDRRRESKKE